MPEKFRFLALDDKISSWIVSTMEKEILAKVLAKAQQTKLLEALRNGKNFQPKPDLTSKAATFRQNRCSVTLRTKSGIITVAKWLEFNLEEVQSNTLQFKLLFFLPADLFHSFLIQYISIC